MLGNKEPEVRSQKPEGNPRPWIKWAQRFVGVCTVAALLWLAASALAAPQPKPQTSDHVFKNVQVLKGIPVDDFLGTMGIMCAALGFDCSDCHPSAGTEKVDWAVDTPKKM